MRENGSFKIHTRESLAATVLCLTSDIQESISSAITRGKYIMCVTKETSSGCLAYERKYDIGMRVNHKQIAFIKIA